MSVYRTPQLKKTWVFPNKYNVTVDLKTCNWYNWETYKHISTDIQRGVPATIRIAFFYQKKTSCEPGLFSQNKDPHNKWV